MHAPFSLSPVSLPLRVSIWTSIIYLTVLAGLAQPNVDFYNPETFPIPAREKRDMYGQNVIQITWLPDCKSLDRLQLHNFESETDADEEFLCRLAHSWQKLSWKMSGRLNLGRTKCDQLGSSQPPDPVGQNISDLPYVTHSNKFAIMSRPLDGSVVDRWSQEIIDAAAGNCEWSFDFRLLNAFYYSKWEYNEGEMIMREIFARKKRREIDS
jgi:hypothetical protein